MRPVTRARRIGLVFIAGAAGSVLAVLLVWHGRSSGVVAAPPIVARAASPTRGRTAPVVVRNVLLGHSALGRPIGAVELVNPASLRKVLVVGCVHGNECAGIAVARRLEARPPASGLDLWVVADLNPDGFAAGTRLNGRGVDLNRNFPYRWRPLGRPGDLHYPGPRPLSEPESRIAYSLILRLHPAITMWFHQALGVVDESGGSLAIERRYARLVDLPLERLPRYPGSAVGWENHRFPGTTSFVVELPPGSLSPQRARVYANAILELAAGAG